MNLHTRNLRAALVTLLFVPPLSGADEAPDPAAYVVRAEARFDEPLREWDGFGFNYVETAQTQDYELDPQEYGGFSVLDETERAELIDLIFGEKGLRVSLVKMFLDPWHQAEPGGPYDHETTTRHMRLFVREGLRKTRERGGDLQIITTLYGPPAWATEQKFLRGRDLDPAMSGALADYMVDWVRFLREKEGFPVRYVSLHNEGEDWLRWPAAGNHGNVGNGHDYNLYWPPEQVGRFIRLMRSCLDAADLPAVGVTNGETTNWYRFSTWGYADELWRDEAARAQLSLITSHGFLNGNLTSRWLGPATSVGVDLLRSKRPELKAWTTSVSWSGMGSWMMKTFHSNIYLAKVNGLIPWAGIQRPPLWVGGDPNPGSAFTVHEDGSYEVRRGYYLYKQLTRAGRPGMAVARTVSTHSPISLFAFSAKGKDHPDAFVVSNAEEVERKVSIRIHGTAARSFAAVQTTEDLERRYEPLGTFAVEEGVLRFHFPPKSVTSFFAAPLKD